jgi:DNA-binding response OmpR family regulator/nitrogen-specific signal transduction histidine kinase
MSGSPYVLLVEDNPITRKLVRFALEHEHLELAEATDGATALAMAQERRPDLILQDLLLPDMDGFELAASLRRIPSVRDVPILAFSGLLSHLDEKRIAGSSFTDFVTKPIEPSKLVRIVRAHLPSGEEPLKSFGAARRIILADDDDVQRKLSAFRLTRLGFQVIDVADGQAALEAARASRPEAIVTDAMMPGLDGFGLCAAIRQGDATKDIPIVLVTSTYVDEADRELGRLAGANQFVIRTPDLREMITALELVLSEAPSTALPAAVQPPEFEKERATRTMVQLERQAAAAASARQQNAMLSAELAVLNAISEAITQGHDIDLVLRDILAACCDAGGVSIGALYLTSANGDDRTIVVGGQGAKDRGTAESFGTDRARFASADAKARARVISRATADASDRAWLETSGLQSALVVPLHQKERSLGVLVMMSEMADLGLDDRLVFAEAVGHQVSVALTLTQAFADSATAARQAREHAALLESVFSSIKDPILVVDQSGRASAWNPSAGSLLGMTEAEHGDVAAGGWAERVGLFQTDQTTPMAAADRPLLRALRGEAADGVDAYLRNARTPAGAWLRISARPLLDDAGAVRGAVSVSRDVTAERLAHEQLLISDRMASIGMMAAGVGHEINNPLSAVVANLEMATTDLAALGAAIGVDQLGELPDEIRGASEAARRVHQIAMDLKVFSGGQADENTPIDVESVLDSAVRMGWNLVQHRARVVRHYGAVPKASGAEARLGQVFLNLIVNAAQAIPDGDAEGNEIRLVTRLDDQDRIVIDIADTGSGIAPHVMSRLFTPFVTTKPVGIGTGLGLSICQRLVNAMGGSIWAESAPGRGTVFHVALPRADAVSVTVSAAPPAGEPGDTARAKILIVDDEDMIGMILRRAFKQHDVTVMTNAREALAEIAAGARYDAIVCDLMMPVMTGIEFHGELTRQFPDQARAIIFLTGGAFTKEAATFLASVGNQQLEKPFDVGRLKDRVNEHLRARAAGQRPTGEAA